VNKRPNAAVLAVRRAVRKLLRHRKFAFRFSLVGLLIAAMTLSGVNTAFAAGGVVTQSINGGPTASAARGDVVNLKAGVPVADAGSLTQSITQWIDPLKMQVRSTADITAPYGWVVSYTTDGTNWTQTAPTTTAGWAAVKGVKATGAINSEGPDQQGNQIASGNATADYPSGGSFAMPGASGDGFDVIFDDRGNLYNIWHHNGSGSLTGVDCHTRAGARCTGAWPFTWNPAVTTNPQTALRSTGWFDNTQNELWFNTETYIGGAWQAGFACVSLGNVATPGWCGGSLTTGGFVTAQTASGCASTTYYCTTGIAQSNGKLFTWNGVSGDIICLDIRANNGLGAPCTVPNISWSSITNAYADWNYEPSIMEWNGNIYGTDWQNVVCVVAATMQPCAGWTTPKLLTANVEHVWRLPSSAGTFPGVCFSSRVNLKCFDVAGNDISSTITTQFAAGYNASINWANSSYTNDPQSVGSRLYWANGGYSSSTGQAGQVFCWEFKTNSWCANWEVQYHGIPVDNYTLTVDPKNETCLWVNTDAGVITTIDGISGSRTCAQRSISFDASVVVPRMGCSPDDAIKSWRNFALTGPPSADYTSATLTVRKQDGTPIAGWIDVPITTASNRIIDLSSIPVSVTGQKPKFIVSFTGRTTGTNATAKVSAIGDAPQLCVTPQTTVCPTSVTALGPYPTSALPPAEAVNVFADSDSTDGFLSVTQLTRGNATLNLPAVPIASCSNTITGRATDASTATPQGIRGATVTLKDSNGVTLNYPSDYPTSALRGQPITTLTDASGNYSFGNVVPGSYKVAFTDGVVGDVWNTTVTSGGTGSTAGLTNIPGTVNVVSSNVVTVAAATAGVVNAIYYNNGQAFPDTSTGMQGAPQDISVLSNDVPGSNANVAGTWTKTKLFFCATGQTNPNCNQLTKTVTGQGTYTINQTTGVVTFTPEPNYVGTATPVDYQITDNYSNTRNSRLHRL
jgi:CshA-type fibril repeat protein